MVEVQSETAKGSRAFEIVLEDYWSTGSCRRLPRLAFINPVAQQEASQLTLGVDLFVLGTRGSISSPSGILSGLRQEVQSSSVLPQVQQYAEESARERHIYAWH